MRGKVGGEGWWGGRVVGGGRFCHDATSVVDWVLKKKDLSFC